MQDQCQQKTKSTRFHMTLTSFSHFNLLDFGNLSQSVWLNVCYSRPVNIAHNPQNSLYQFCPHLLCIVYDNVMCIASRCIAYLPYLQVSTDLHTDSIIS